MSITAQCARDLSCSRGWRLVRTGLLVLLLSATAVCWSQTRRSGGERAVPMQRPQYRPQVQRPQYRHQARPQAQPGRPSVNPRANMGTRQPMQRGQEHLPTWWASHRELSPQQQADALRRQPGFRNLPQQQQQRLINRLQRFDRQPPMEQQRMMDRNEMFERLSPERRQQVRGATQAYREMPPQRQAMMRHAFQQLRQMPLDERERMLNSGYGTQFTPRERNILGNLLSVEPYEPRIAQPYFGR